MKTAEAGLRDEVTGIFQAQRAYQPIIKQTSAADRIEKLNALKGAILKYKDEMIAAMYRDFNKPPFETLGIEIYFLVNEIDDTCAKLADWMEPEKVIPATNPEATAAIIYEPRGTVLIMGPWNFPFLLSVSPLIAAISAGNSAVLKPSELTPLVSAVIKKIVGSVFDEQEIAVVEGGVDITTELLKLPFDHIFLTGSPKVGKIVMAAAAQNLASVTLELGGKSPAIVDFGAVLSKAVPRIMKGKTVNAGQICMATDYVMLPAELQDQFIAEAKTYVEKKYFKDGTFNNEDYAQIINQQNFDRLRYLFDDAVLKGAKVEMGGVFDTATRRIQPTILTNVPADAAIMGEEIFGPITPIINYNTKEEALSFVSKLSKPLAFYVFSEDQQTIDYYIRHSTSGGVCINDAMQQAFDLNLPFGGVNTSGIGGYHGIYGFWEFSHRRSVFYQSPETPVDEFQVAPYAGKTDIVWQQLTKGTAQ